MAFALTPTPMQRFVDNNGNALSGGKLFTYAAGTTTKLATYTDSTGATPNANPIILNTRGEAPIWLPPDVGYKFVLSPSTDTDPPTNPIWTVDQINGIGPTATTFYSGNGVLSASATRGANGTSGTLYFLPYNGNQITMPNGLTYTIPSGGVTALAANCFLAKVANSALVTNTLYYVYLWVNGSTLTLNFDTTGHATDATSGLEIRSGDATQLLLGMVQTNNDGTNNFRNDFSFRGVLNWLNRQTLRFEVHNTGSPTLTNTSGWQQIGSVTAYFLTWSGASIRGIGTTWNSTATDSTSTGVTVDATSGITGQQQTFTSTGASDQGPVACAYNSLAAEGFHFAVLVGQVSGGTGNWTPFGIIGEIHG